MAATKLEDVIVPEIFNPYVIERTAELSALWQAGIVSTVSDISLGEGGSTVQMPFWQDLTGDDQVLDTSTDLTVEKISASKDVAVVNGRALVYGATDLSGALAGDDPMRAIGDLMADKWARQMQKVVINVLNGAMGAMGDESKNTLDISGLSGAAAVLDSDAFIDALGTLGDAEGKIQALAVHSATHRLMKKQGLIETIPPEDGKEEISLYQGKRVIVDDGMPVSTGTYTTYLFGAGAIGYAEGAPKTPSETQREGLKNGGEEYLINRRHFVLHPRGIKWDPGSGVPAKDTPSNTELAAKANWTRVYESKNIRIVRLVHKIA
ncbi:MAG: major capsid protein [Xanthobacteraceae bacterium]